METHNLQKRENKEKALDNKTLQSNQPTPGFVDNRPGAVAQRRLQELADNSPRVKQLKAYQAMADNYSSGTVQKKENPEEKIAQKKSGPIQKQESNLTSQNHTAFNIIQRMKNVTLETDEKSKKSIEAEGTVKEFKDGTSPGNKGWLGVEKYRAYYQIDSADGKYQDKGEVGPLKNSFTNPEAGHVLAKQNGGNGGDPENIFAQDGGTNNGLYKSFEIDMRKNLNKYKSGDKVFFKSYLVGDEIEEGTISDGGLSDASSISSDDESSDSSMSV